MAEKRSTGFAPNVRRKLQGFVAWAPALLIVALLAGCGGGSGSGSAAKGGASAPAAKAGVLSAAEAKALLDAHPEALVLDVREPSEWNDDLGHIERARQIPSGQVGSRVAELAEFKDKPVVVVCRVGMRSHYAAQFLASQGFTQVANLNGGMDAWRKAGY